MSCYPKVGDLVKVSLEFRLFMESRNWQTPGIDKEMARGKKPFGLLVKLDESFGDCHVLMFDGRTETWNIHRIDTWAG